jgi:ABC-type Mn2+/Zn2+ transport system ATPase subunit
MRGDSATHGLPAMVLAALCLVCCVCSVSTFTSSAAFSNNIWSAKRAQGSPISNRCTSAFQPFGLNVHRKRVTGLRIFAQSVNAATSNAVEEKAGEVRINVNPDVNPMYGETGGAMLIMEDVTISRGDRDLMSEVNWRLMPKDRIGLVGPNGAGKSTLLSASCGRIPVMGKVLVKPGVSLGYLVQTAVSGSRRTCWEEASSQMHRLNAAQAALDAAAAACAAGDTSEAALNRLAETQDAFGAAGGYNVDEKVASVLSGLGFRTEDYTKPCTDFSGGWQMKIALARLLLSEPDMLLLDEPTNHLDSAAKAWLGRYIAAYEGTVVIVTHEEALLRSAALSGVIEVRDQRGVFKTMDTLKRMDSIMESLELNRAFSLTVRLRPLNRGAFP